MRMPFGKYKGIDIENIPSSYLLWVAENVINNSEIVAECNKEWQYREKYNCHIEEEGT